jgi:hypothetical protein
MFSSIYLGWNADYPDPENFFFLLDGHEGKVAAWGRKRRQLRQSRI